MEGHSFTPPIIVVDEALAAQLLEDGERLLEGVTAIVDALLTMKPRELRVVVSSAAPSTNNGVVDGRV